MNKITFIENLSLLLGIIIPIVYIIIKKMAKPNKDIVDILIKKNQDCQIMENALAAILMNTLHRDFNGDFIYKSGVLMNIKMALGDEKYEYYKELYT
jgi:hypothetical protein